MTDLKDLARRVSETCETCRWWKAHTPVDVPPEPATTTKFLWFTVARDGFCVRVDRMRREDALEHNASGLCRRFPEPTAKRGTSFCGEYQPKETPHDRP